MAFSSPLVSLWSGKEDKMNNRQRVAEDVEISAKLAAEKGVVGQDVMTNGILSVIAIELAGLNDELHALNLKIDKLTKEVGKRK